MAAPIHIVVSQFMLSAQVAVFERSIDWRDLGLDSELLCFLESCSNLDSGRFACRVTNRVILQSREDKAIPGINVLGRVNLELKGWTQDLGTPVASCDCIRGVTRQCIRVHAFVVVVLLTAIRRFEWRDVLKVLEWLLLEQMESFEFWDDPIPSWLLDQPRSFVCTHSSSARRDHHFSTGDWVRMALAVQRHHVNHVVFQTQCHRGWLAACGADYFWIVFCRYWNL